MNINVSFEQVKHLIKARLTTKLYRHSLGVQETAMKLARQYGIDEEKAALAGLLHDFGKSLSLDEQHRLAKDLDLADEVCLYEPVLLHGPVGAYLIEQEFEEQFDEEVLEAVKKHTTGAPGLSPLAQIIYLADYIEPGRTCPGVESIRELAFRDFKRALLGAVDMTIKYVLEREKLLHPDSISFRNALLLYIRKEV